MASTRFASPDAFPTSQVPGGQSVLFTVGTRRDSDSWDQKIVVQSLKTGERKTLVDGAGDALYLPGGHLIYTKDSRNGGAFYISRPLSTFGRYASTFGQFTKL